MKDINKEIILVTGASTGIGKATALLMDKLGYQVFAGVRTNQAAENIQKDSSSRLTPLILDITRSEHIDNAFEIISDCAAGAGQLCALVNNAGYTEAGPLEFLPIDRLRYQLEVNTIGHFAITQKFLPLIRQSRGRIINTGSPAGFFSSPFIGAYNISKHALTAFNDSLRRELKPWGIHVVLIVPGFIETPIWDKSYSEMDRLINSLPEHDREKYQSSIANGRRFMDVKGRSRAITPDQVAISISRAIQAKHPKSLYFAGIDGYFSFGIGKFVPGFIVDMVTSRILKGKF
ncbi:MAG: SDR family oxidoreductase [Desulfatirhabdiaceae bacterium]